MLNDQLRNQIEHHLGKEQIIPSAYALLFESISREYSNLQDTLKGLQNRLNEATALAEEYRHNFIQLSSIFENTAARLYELTCTSALKPDEEKNNHITGSDGKNLQGMIEIIALNLSTLYKSNGDLQKKLTEMENINRELDQFGYIVSHDLKAPLRAISNLSQWIEDDLSECQKESVRENFKLLRSRVYRMESLINAILTYSKATKSKHQTTLSDTSWLLHEVIDSLNCPENITIEIQGEFPVLDTESIKLQQVFANLISNSIKYNDKEKGKIEVGVFETEEYCQFYVKDNGPGIEPQFQKKVFMIFQTLEAKDEYESTGIGLAIVKKIIEECGGKIWIESEKGCGAKFVFLWPKRNKEILQNH